MDKIFCKTTAKGIQSFFLNYNDKEYFLFSQPYRTSVRNHFRYGITIDECSNYSDGSFAVRKTLDKMHSYVSYAEREYGIAVFNKTKKKQFKQKSHPYVRKRVSINDLEYVG